MTSIHDTSCWNFGKSNSLFLNSSKEREPCRNFTTSKASNSTGKPYQSKDISSDKWRERASFQAKRKGGGGNGMVSFTCSVQSEQENSREKKRMKQAESEESEEEEEEEEVTEGVCSDGRRDDDHRLQTCEGKEVLRLQESTGR